MSSEMTTEELNNSCNGCKYHIDRKGARAGTKCITTISRGNPEYNTKNEACNVLNDNDSCNSDNPEFTNNNCRFVENIIETDQTCGRILKRNSDGKYTNEGCEDCSLSLSEDSCNSPHCEWNQTTQSCILKSGTSIGNECTLYSCPSQCKFPFINEKAYIDGEASKSEVTDIITNNLIVLDNKVQQINYLTDPTKYNIDYYTITSNQPSGNEMSPNDPLFTDVYGGVDSTEGNNCGNVVKPKNPYHHIKYPEPPDFDDFLDIVKNQRNISGEINWLAIKPRSVKLFYENNPSQQYFNANSLRNYYTLMEQSNTQAPQRPNFIEFTDKNGSNHQIPLSNNGISLQWWATDNTIGELISEDDIPKGITAETITNATLNQSTDSQSTTLYSILSSIKDGYDFSKICQQQLREYDTMILATPTEEDYFVFSFLLNVGPDQEQNRSFEKCMNRLINTGDNDKEMVSNIRKLDRLQDLGDSKNSELLNYVEKKIKKFLSIKSNQFNKCIEKIIISDNICINGLFPNAMEMLGKILDMETGRGVPKAEKNINTSGSVSDLRDSLRNYHSEKTIDIQEEEKVKVVSDRLLKYVPALIKKILEISSDYENEYCGSISPKTKLLQEVYDNLFKKDITIKLPDLGLNNFFSDFNDGGLIGKIILMVFFLYVLSQIISLFKVNVSL